MASERDWVCKQCTWTHAASHSACNWCAGLNGHKSWWGGYQNTRGSEARGRGRAYEPSQQRGPRQARSQNRTRGEGRRSAPQNSQGDGRGGFGQPRSQDSPPSQAKWARVKADPEAKAAGKARDRAAHKAAVEANSRRRLAQFKDELSALEAKIVAEERDLALREVAAATAEAEALKLEQELEERDNQEWVDGNTGDWDGGWAAATDSPSASPELKEYVGRLLTSPNPDVQKAVRLMCKAGMISCKAGALEPTQDDAMEDVIGMAINESNSDEILEGLSRIDREHEGDEAVSLKRQLLQTFQASVPRAAKAARLSA